MTVNCDSNVSTDVSEADHDNENDQNNETGITSDNKHEQVDLNNNSENGADASGEDKTYFQLKIPILCEKSELSPANLSDTCNVPQTNKESDEDNNDILVNLTKTAKEMREIIMRRKKKDPRREKRKDIKRRVEMIEEL